MSDKKKPRTIVRPFDYFLAVLVALAAVASVGTSLKVTADAKTELPSRGR